MVALRDLDGLGPAKIDKLANIGVTNVQELAELDLRKLRDPPFGRDVLRRAKAQARRELDKAGIPYARAMYAGHVNDPGADASAPRTNLGMAPREPMIRVEGKPANNVSSDAPRFESPRRGLLARVFGRSNAP